MHPLAHTMTEFASFLGSQALSDVEVVCIKRRRDGPADSTAGGSAEPSSPIDQEVEVLRRFPGHAVVLAGEEGVNWHPLCLRVRIRAQHGRPLKQP